MTSTLRPSTSSGLLNRPLPDDVPPVGDILKAWGTMGHISERKREDGTIAYRAELVIRQDGKRHKFTKTFDRESAAKKWLEKKARDLRKPGALVQAKGRTVGDAIDLYIADADRMGKTKAQVLAAIKSFPIARQDATRVDADDLVDFARELRRERQPQTVGNYMSHLSAVFALARPAWGVPLDKATMQEALVACKRLGITAKSGKRDRRPTVDEMNALMAHFEDRHIRRGTIPMHAISAFAMFSSRRQEEIIRLARADYEPEHDRILVRDMKHPGEKRGNDVWCEVPPEAARIIDAWGKAPILFPYTTDAISAAFTRACKLLGIEDLHFHDLRHEAASRLFENGRTIPQVASVTGHRSWASLQRYSHLRATGDKWAGWDWLDRICKED